MNLFGRSTSARYTAEEPADPLQAVKVAALELERAKLVRDQAIGYARAQRVGLQRIASAADLSVSRVKQIDVGSTVPMHAPVTDVDLPIEMDRPDGDRVFGIDEVDPFLRRWPSERAFMEENDERYPFADVTRVLDLGPEQWNVCYATGTHELYAWTARAKDAEYDGREDESTANVHGPCVLLGHVFSMDLVIQGISRPGANLNRRPGGLAWVYGRARLLNSTLRVMAGDYRGEEDLIDYLEALPESEKR